MPLLVKGYEKNACKYAGVLLAGGLDMIIAPDHPKEEERLSALLRYEVLDSEDETAFDELTKLAAFICETPFALFNLLDGRRLWCKSRVGLDVHETGRDIAFCSHTILQDDIFQVQDALKDERFYDNPFVAGEPRLRFYAGIPLFSEDALPIGTLCVLDPRPRWLTVEQRNALRVLARQVINQLEIRLNNRRLARLSHQYDLMLATLAHDLGSPFNGILGNAQLLNDLGGDVPAVEIREMAQGIYVSSLKVYQLLDELMQWSRYNMGAVPDLLQSCDVSAMLDETSDFLQEAFELKQLTLINRLGRGLKIKGEPTLVKTMLRNLITNAIKYSPQGGSVFVEFHHVVKDAVDLSVTDEGEGFAEDVADRLFSEHVESHSGSQEEIGHGLGLYLCRKLAGLQGGEIFIDPQYSHGARVVIRMRSAGEE
jgi:signal transduction histidine kinase